MNSKKILINLSIVFLIFAVRGYNPQNSLIKKSNKKND